MDNQRIPGWSGLERTSKLILFHPPTMGRDAFHKTRLLQAPSNPAWDTSRDGASLRAFLYCRVHLPVGRAAQKWGDIWHLVPITVPKAG